MESLITYRNEAIKENSWSVNEETEKYYRLLDKATTRFISELEDIEKRFLDSKESPDALLNAVTNAINNISDVCEEFEQGVGYDKDIIKETQMRFRERTNSILSKSYFINRARIWPQGCQGDYKMLESAYKSTPLSAGIGYYLDLYFLKRDALAEGVKNRIKKLEEMLRDEIIMRKKPSILNIACGSCRELMGITSEISASDAKIICIDNDNDALAFAQSRLSYAELPTPIEFYKYNVLRMFDSEVGMTEFGKQDIIYSVGLFDYLPDDFLVKMLRTLYHLLNPGGKLIAAFKDADRYKHQIYHWPLNWDGFLQRREEDFDRIIEEAGIPDSALSQTRDKSGVIIFYTATK